MKETIIMNPQNLNEIIAWNIKRIREELNMSRWEFSKRTGIHYQNLARYEQGKIDMRASTLEKLIKGLNISFEDLMIFKP